MSGRPRPSHVAVAVGAAATVVGALPALLTGALAPQLSETLAFGPAVLGAAFAVQSAAGALTAVPLGRLADRLGATRSLRLAMMTTALVSLAIATAVRSAAGLTLLLALGGLAKRLIEPASNRLLISRVGDRRLGLAFGMKQSAPPMSAMLAGLSVPIVATGWGWRGAYVLAALMAVTLSLVRPPPAEAGTDAARRTSPSDPEGRARSGATPVLLLSLAFGLSNAASTTVPIFYVSAAVDAGTRQAVAGLLLSVASVAAIAARLILGVVTDRLGTGHLRLCAAMLAGGAVGFMLLASGHPLAVAAGVVLALAGTWGFSGVFWFTLVRANPSRPGAITGKVAAGALVGASARPVIFGLLVDRYSYGNAWLFAGTIATLAAVGMAHADRRLVTAGAA